MRRTFLPLLATAALIPFGCGRQPAPTPSPGTTSALSDARYELATSSALRGRALVEVAKDGWMVRTLGGATGGGDRDARISRAARGGMPAPGSLAPPEGAPVSESVEAPMDAMGSAEELGMVAESDGGPMPASSPAGPASGSAAGLGGGGGGDAAKKARLPGLKAGSIDDNAAFDEFLTFLATWTDQAGVADQARVVDVSDRTWIRVVGRNGAPLPLARVTVIDEQHDRIAWTGSTLGDGRLAFYPHADGAQLPAAWRVEVKHGTTSHVARLDAQARELEVRLDTTYAMPTALPLDVCFLIDTTGSMGDEIERIKQTLLSVTAQLRELAVEFDLRYGAVLYRDITDEYVTMRRPFSNDIEAFDTALRAVTANGGGDGPESLNQGLYEAVGQMDWRQDAAKLCFLVADAPPHMDYVGDVPYDLSMRAAVDRGIRVHSVAASGIDPFGSLVMRQVAQMTRGKFTFIEYGGDVAASGAAHGVSRPGTSNNLDAILFAAIQDELAGWGRAAPLPAADVQASAAPVDME